MVDAAKVRIVMVCALVSAAIGAIYTYVAHDALLLGTSMGAAFGTIFPSIEIILLKGEAGAWLRRAPFPVFLAVRIAA